MSLWLVGTSRRDVTARKASGTIMPMVLAMPNVAPLSGADSAARCPYPRRAPSLPTKLGLQFLIFNFPF
jgi:hypothetical protein